MKVFHIDSEKTFRGGQQQVLYLLEGLRKYGVENILICPGASPLFQRCSGVKKESAAMISEFDIFSAIKTAKLINAEKPDILHCHSAHALSVGVMARFFSKQKPKIIASRRVDFRIKSRRKYLSADKIITVSKAIKKILVKNGIPEGRIEVVYSGVELKSREADCLKKEFNLSEKDFIVGNVAALTHQKDHKTLLKAVSLLVRNNENLKFFIIGEGVLHNGLAKLSKELGISENVIFTGFRNDVANFYSLFGIFVSSSAWEGLGTSILDAMLSGVPVVATAVGGIPEIIEDGVDGFLVPHLNPLKMSEKIDALIKNAALREKFSQNGIRKAMKFSVEKMVSGSFEVYKKLLNEKNSRNTD
ncbi:MAG: glycosyltransferase family 4 protein [bacterium]